MPDKIMLPISTFSNPPLHWRRKRGVLRAMKLLDATNDDSKCEVVVQ